MGGLIPLADASRQTRHSPVVTRTIIVVNSIVFVFELIGGEAFVRQWSVIPADIAAGRHYITILTTMFMHAGWMHIIGNMVFLWAFGHVSQCCDASLSPDRTGGQRAALPSGGTGCVYKGRTESSGGDLVITTFWNDGLMIHTPANRDNKPHRTGVSKNHTSIAVASLIILIVAAVLPVSAQDSKLLKFLQESVALTPDQIAAIRKGQPVTKTLPSRKPAEVFLFGAVYIHATPESYLKFAQDFDRLRKLPNYLALGVFGNPPQASDLKNFSFDGDDIKALKSCKPGDCLIQMPTSSIEALQSSIDWSAPDVSEQVNRHLQKTALQRLLEYQQQGNQTLGVYNDKHDPTEVPQQFAYMLSYSKALPEDLPDFYQYLLDYPKAKPSNVDDAFYWARVKFGLKPTLRIVQMVTLRGNPNDPVAYAIAQKQLYASHYFETAVDLSFCVRGRDDSQQPGFYLLMAMGSEQAGLTGVKGSIVRKTAVGRSVSNLQNALSNIKTALEGNE